MPVFFDTHTSIHTQIVILVCIFTLHTYNRLYDMAHMPYAQLILHTDGYDPDTDTYERRHMSAYVPICAYISMYPILLVVHLCLYVWYMHVTYMHIQAYMH